MYYMEEEHGTKCELEEFKKTTAEFLRLKRAVKKINKEKLLLH